MLGVWAFTHRFVYGMYLHIVIYILHIHNTYINHYIVGCGGDDRHDSSFSNAGMHACINAGGGLRAGIAIGNSEESGESKLQLTSSSVSVGTAPVTTCGGGTSTCVEATAGVPSDASTKPIGLCWQSSH